MAITRIRIFPSIGIARIGNAETEFFIGPEIPGRHERPDGGYKDATCRIKRQAARFRLYAYDENDQLILENGKPKEVTAADGAITWRVELANIKGSARRFYPLDSTERRNKDIDAALVEITPGPRELAGANQTAKFDDGSFLGVAVDLGEARTDDQGRLIVLGGRGQSAWVGEGDVPALGNDYDHDLWYDDVSDGPIHAKVVIGNVTFDSMQPDGNLLPAWVIVAPPKFVPSVDPVVTLHDSLAQKAGMTAPAKPSFNRDIYPILRRALDVVRLTYVLPSTHTSFPLSALPGNQKLRQDVVARVRNPANPDADPTKANMPLLLATNEIDKTKGPLTVTQRQYDILTAWTKAPGADWTDDWTGAPPDPATDILPDELTRAALEACVGGGLRPGIEAGRELRDAFAFIEPFRIDPAGRRAGDATARMAVPWQGDFHVCRLEAEGAWWPSHRPDRAFREDLGDFDDWTLSKDYPNITSPEEMVDSWSLLGFVVENESGLLVETERRPVCRKISFFADTISFSRSDVATALQTGAAAVFDRRLTVIADGFTPAELGILDAAPDPLAVAPTITLLRPDGITPVPKEEMQPVPKPVGFSLSVFDKSKLQRITFDYDIVFPSQKAFLDATGTPIEEQVLTATASKDWSGELSGTATATASVHLESPRAPSMVDGVGGNPYWVSADLRVFRVREGDTPFPGLVPTIGGDKQAALKFIADVVAAFNQPTAGAHPFDAILTDDPNASQLRLAQTEDAKPVFNFAVARVRNQSKGLPAKNVRVFFRLFSTAALGLGYDPAAAYRRSAADESAIALLGLEAGTVVNVPCFGRARVDSATQALTAQHDDLNVRTIPAAAGKDQAEAFAYFGCWLDLNQVEPQFPQQPGPLQPDGPWPGVERLPIQQLMKGPHQCLVAEIHFPADPIPFGATMDDPRLAQRNLVFVESGNPGDSATRTVQHTFAIKAANGQAGAADRPGEVMIRWESLPRDTRMLLYMPELDASAVHRLAGKGMGPPGFKPIDGHTLECGPADVTYVPIPRGPSGQIAALLTLELPAGVKRGQLFGLSVHQASGHPRRVLGSFQFNIPVSTEAALLAPETSRLSVLRHIAGVIPIEDPWHAVFVRYLAQVAARVRGFGGDPDAVAPTADGSGRDPARIRCARIEWLFAALLALAVVLGGVIRPPAGVFLAFAAVFSAAIVEWYWLSICRTGWCRAALAGGTGLATGAAVLASLWLLGWGGAALMTWLALAAVIAAALLVAAFVCGCCSSPPGWSSG